MEIMPGACESSHTRECEGIANCPTASVLKLEKAEAREGGQRRRETSKNQMEKNCVRKILLPAYCFQSDHRKKRKKKPTDK